MTKSVFVICMWIVVLKIIVSNAKENQANNGVQFVLRDAVKNSQGKYPPKDYSILNLSIYLPRAKKSSKMILNFMNATGLGNDVAKFHKNNPCTSNTDNQHSMSYAKPMNIDQIKYNGNFYPHTSALSTAKDNPHKTSLNCSKLNTNVVNPIHPSFQDKPPMTYGNPTQTIYNHQNFKPSPFETLSQPTKHNSKSKPTQKSNGQLHTDIHKGKVLKQNIQQAFSLNVNPANNNHKIAGFIKNPNSSNSLWTKPKSNKIRTKYQNKIHQLTKPLTKKRKANFNDSHNLSNTPALLNNHIIYHESSEFSSPDYAQASHKSSKKIKSPNQNIVSPPTYKGNSSTTHSHSIPSLKTSGDHKKNQKMIMEPIATSNNDEDIQFSQDIYIDKKSPDEIEFGHTVDSPDRIQKSIEANNHKNHRYKGKVIWKEKSGDNGGHFWDYAYGKSER